MVGILGGWTADVATGTSRARRWITRIAFVGLFAAAVAAAIAAVTYATGGWGRLSDTEQAEARRAVVGYELAKASVRRPGMVGKKLTKRDKAVLQARFRRELARYSTGAALAWGKEPSRSRTG